MRAILKFFKISIRTILKKAKNIYIISGGLAYRTVEVMDTAHTIAGAAARYERDKTKSAQDIMVAK